jgi:hypothetical protein
VVLAEQIIIAGIEELRVFAHEPPEFWIVCPGAIFVKIKSRGRVSGSVGGGVFSSGEQETVVVNGGCARGPAGRVNGRRAESIVAIPLNHVTGAISQQRHAAFMVLLGKIRVPITVRTNGDALQDLVDPFPIYINAD